ncbi:hypothetical protein THIOKS12260014 [Thiocapsa sp. KS1]|nr:hypothetical protein THIOKS12260014 [Thiocapsa sp. KS1]
MLANLADRQGWPESVENGLVLLAWMLKAGCLEIRVALRRHRKTGAPSPTIRASMVMCTRNGPSSRMPRVIG